MVALRRCLAFELYIQNVSFAMTASTPSLDLALPLAWVVGT